MYSKKNTPPGAQPAHFSDEIEGSAQGHRDGHGFVVRDDGEGDIYIPPNEMRAVLHKDRVRVRIVRQDRRGRPEGRVLEIIERPPQPIIGRLLQESGVWLVAPEDKRYGQDVLVPKGATGAARPGQVVVVELIEPPALFGQPVGRVTEVLGEVDDPGLEVEIAVRKYGVPHEFSAACLAQAKELPDKVRAQDKRRRVDLTDVPLVTIDGEDARDFDDAVYCEPARVGRSKGWRLLVAIADVSHYVETGSAIDVDAYDRATSVYFPRRVIPMLPEKLSNGLCSLNPEVERLCMVCDMLVTAKGQVHAYQFYPAVMYSHARFTYTEVAAILANTRGPEAGRRGERVRDLLNLHDVYRALLLARRERGAVDFESTETQIVCDENGRIEKIVPRTRNDAHRLIEEAMLAANVCSADFIAQGGQPGLFRVHEGPTPEKQEMLRGYLKSMAVGMTIGDDPRPAEFQAIAEATRDRPDAQQIHTMLLRSMQQAIYTPTNSGHFGLAFTAYTHFTSPIRRYPDLLVHRVIKAILCGTRYRLPVLPTPGEAQAKLVKRLAARGAAPGAGARKDAPPPSRETQAWEAAGLHCSAHERRADEASRDVEAWLKCRYMRAHLGEEFSGVVSTATGFGIFVTLDAMYVEGLVHITELGGEYFKFDEARQELRGERTGIRYAIGTRVRVQVSRVDLDGRKIDFRLVREGEELPERASKDKGSAGAGANARKAGGRRSGKADKVDAAPAATGLAGRTRERAARAPAALLKAGAEKVVAQKAVRAKARKPRRS
ncbi:ribonuclease R [Verminephrobacter aporrectodeae subsp. tuberculatae]|uniref:ribonuclease R n=1 Tax=Verminephrobacter aporrectodeae TaxID=1110389 RepID=UPI0022382C44|nr:ribonuclease R [Verminephrobacter aporrectodeae]MCW5220300.1 ribonuclease R [Verminephrobacter aporrectodeae subsp. tuberculatae]MCW5289594.1 ribonuclease R [Verminephrobacter aporrectodeae subsp. tuberculatae]